MDYKTGTVNVSDYVLSFDVVATPSVIPEAGTLSMMLMGAGGLLLVTRRRSASTTP
jgi:hypothetical protein